MNEGILFMVGKTMASVSPAEKGSEELKFTADDGMVFTFSHNQSCCETVEIEDICGDLEDLVGSPILQADEVESENEGDPEGFGGRHYDSYTWTFYKFATSRGSVTVRWLGESNGYYSESVDLRITPSPGK